MISRRHLLQGLSASSVGSVALGGYAVAEPRRLALTTYHLSPPDWPRGLELRIAVLADLHACRPWMDIERIDAIVERTNQLQADAVLLLGDYVAGSKMLRFARPVAERDWARALARLKAPFGVHAVLGNHDWWDDEEVQLARSGVPVAWRALEEAGIPVYENRASRHVKDGHAFWITGLGDQAAFAPWFARDYRSPHAAWKGNHDLQGTLRLVNDDAPIIMMAHEPDIFPQVPHRVALTVCGHTHGGQVRLPGLTPYVPSLYGGRYRYGHIVEDHRHLVVSGGLGCSAVPVRLGVPPEIVVLELGSWSPVVTS